AVDISLATTTARLGEAVAIMASASLPMDHKLKLNLEASATDLYAISSVEEDSTAGGVSGSGGYRAILRIQLVPLAPGRLSVNLPWTLVEPGGQKPLAASSFELDVLEPEIEPDGALRDIKAPRRARPALWPWLLAALLGAALWWLWRRRGGAEKAFEAAKEEHRPADIIALEELAALEGSGLWAKGERKLFYSRLSEIIRRYLERRFDIAATRLTSSELNRQLRQAGMERGLVLLIKECFERGDLVKFSKMEASEPWGAADLRIARKLVAETSEKVPEPAGGNRP
ncbi:MAG: hypothetical protein HY549_04065, partial [Elusimicrobia bacterium]|nr:hypothetical protein [Elusimicrobiota bacterium]